MVKLFDRWVNIAILRPDHLHTHQKLHDTISDPMFMQDNPKVHTADVGMEFWGESQCVGYGVAVILHPPSSLHFTRQLGLAFLPLNSAKFFQSFAQLLRFIVLCHPESFEIEMPYRC